MQFWGGEVFDVLRVVLSLKMLKCREQSCGDFSPNQMAWQGEKMQFWGFESSRGCGFTCGWEQGSPCAEFRVHLYKTPNCSSLAQANRGTALLGCSHTTGEHAFLCFFPVRDSCSYTVKSFTTVKIEYLYKIAWDYSGLREVEFKRGKQLSLSHDLLSWSLFLVFATAPMAFLISFLGCSYPWCQRQPHPGLW